MPLIGSLENGEQGRLAVLPVRYPLNETLLSGKHLYPKEEKSRAQSLYRNSYAPNQTHCGKHRYVPVAVHANGRLKPLTGVVDGEPVSEPEGAYYLRYRTQRRRVLKPLGKDPQAAMTAKLRRDHLLKGESLGMIPSEIAQIASNSLNVDETPSNLLTLDQAIAVFLA